jgi:type II secretory pathway component PulC
MRTIAVLSLVLFACAENGLPPDSPAGMSDLSASPPEPPPLPPNTLRRSDVKRAVAEGVGAFLQHLELDDRPVFLAGKFHGFRVTALRGDPRFWRGVDLRPGDVVTRVNGLAIERPEDAQQALQSLEVASELRVEIERGGESRELRFAIIDDEPPGTPPPPKK